MKTLETISLTRLSVLEFGQHIKSIITNISQLGGGPGFITDASLLNYLGQLQSKSDVYDQALVQIAKSDETDKIIAADKVRDMAVSAATRYLNVFELSEVEAEKLAFASLDTLFNSYKGIQDWNLEEESNGLDNLVVDLQGAKYAPHVTTLNMSTYVDRMHLGNEAFKILFNNRTLEKSSKQVFDMRAMRAEIAFIYADMADYVLAMAKVKDTNEFNQPLNVINTVRKYYSDLLAKRKATSGGTIPVPPPAK